MTKAHIMAMAALTAAAAGAQAQQPAYPEAPRDPDVADTYFGTVVADPWRPLEDDRAEATLAWVEAENELTRQWLDAAAGRDSIRTRLTELYDYRRTGLPRRGNDGRYYVSENDGLSPQAIVYVADSLKGERRVFIDPNRLSADGTVALTGIYQSPDGSLTAYTIARNGSDWTEIYVMDTATGRLLDDHIEWGKFTGVSWLGNDSFFYSAYPRPAEGDELKGANEGHAVYLHRLGTPQAADIIAFADPANPLHFHRGHVAEGDDMLYVSIEGQGIGNALMARKAAATGADAGPWLVIAPDQTKQVEPVGVKDGRVYLLTNIGAERLRIVSAPADNPVQANWTEFAPEQPGVLANALLAGDLMLLQYEQDAIDHIDLRSLADGGRLVGRIDGPEPGTMAMTASRTDGTQAFYSLTTFTRPAEARRIDLATGADERLWGGEIKGWDPDRYVTTQVWVESADGTRVPLFLTHRKDITPDGTNPAYLYGYGGFNISMKPMFSAARLLWLERGGIYAQAVLRGGGEYGEAWHVAGTKLQKQNVFDDFIACGQWLVDQGWTRPGLLTIEGGSNGGLLVGACVNQRPDLWGVAIPRVGVMDMMRYHLFTIGWNWASDYGRSDDSPEMAACLLAYSPLHNIKNDGTAYPAILVTTADHDDRVVPAHSFKYAARLQASDTGPRPKLIRIDSNAGHGAGKSTGKIIDEWTDIYTFIFNNLER